MHEFSMCQTLIASLQRMSQEHQHRTLKKVVVQVGPLAGVEPDLLIYAFPFVADNTLFSKTILVIETDAITVQCKDCQIVSQVTINDLRCRLCGSQHTQLASGDSCAITRLVYGD